MICWKENKSYTRYFWVEKSCVFDKDFWKAQQKVRCLFVFDSLKFAPFRFEEFSHILDYSRVLDSSGIFTRYPFPVCRSFLWARHLKISDFIKFKKLTMFWKKFYLDFTLLYNWKTLFLSIQFSILYFFCQWPCRFFVVPSLNKFQEKVTLDILHWEKKLCFWRGKKRYNFFWPRAPKIWPRGKVRPPKKTLFLNLNL